MNIPESVINIDSLAFQGCISLRQITIPNSVLNLGTNPFSIGTSLLLKSKSKRFVIANGLLIDKQCNSIISYNGHHKSIIIPNSIFRIENLAFYECEYLQQIIIPDSVLSIGNAAFSHCKSLQQITIPDSVTNIGNWAFLECESLKQIIIPKNSVEKFKQLLPEEIWDKLCYLQRASNDCSDDCCFTIF